MSDRRGDSGWIQTYSGGRFWPLEPLAKDVRIGDIAHALAMQCRFTGHCREFYSVAQHSVLVSELCPPELRLWGLLHDAAEAYLADVARPVKHLPEMRGYRAAEARIMNAIAEAFGLELPIPAAVKKADTIALGAEALAFMSPLAEPRAWEWCTSEAALCRSPALEICEAGWTPEHAERMFKRRFSAVDAAAAA